jgi:hypothetical protein
MEYSQSRYHRIGYPTKGGRPTNTPPLLRALGTCVWNPNAPIRPTRQFEAAQKYEILNLDKMDNLS